MVDHRNEAPGEHGDPVPRDLPDQQADGGEDPWEVTPDRGKGDSRDAEEPEETTESTDVPDTDEAGTGREGAPHSGSVNPEQPVPDEPSA